MSKLLRFLVDHKLQGERKPLTAYAIAVDALDRDDGFDTQIDSYPRVQIGRLRRLLDHFYLRESGGKRLSIPFHNYEIVLEPNEPIEATAHLLGGARPIVEKPPGSPTVALGAPTGPSDAETGQTGRLVPIVLDYIWPVIIVGALAVIGAFYYLQQTAPTTAKTISYPAIIVEGAENISRSSSRAKTQMTHSYLIGALKRFDQLRVFDEDVNGQNGHQYVLESSIFNEAADRIQLRLVDSATREVIWSSPIEVGTIEALEADLDQAVVAIASPHGKIAQHELSKYRGDYSPGYPCLLQFHQFLRYREKALLRPALRCMEISAEQFPNDSYLMSMLVVAKSLSEEFGGPHEIDGISRDFALKAAKLDNDSASATFAVAQSAFFEGDCRRGVAWGERAVRLNPLNSRIMGYLGLYMLACRMPEGEAYSTRALQMDPDADLVVAATLAMQKLRRGDAKAAQQLASKYMDSAPGTTPGLEISYILSTAMLGDKDEARRAWRSLAERSGLSESAPPREVLSKWMSNPLLISELEADFVKAQLY